MMNKVILMGRLVRDPEVRYTQSDQPMAIARFTLAVNRRFKRQGEQDTDFIPCVAFGKQGEFAEKYLSKGRLIAVSGRLQVRNWEDNNGNKRTAIEVVVEEHYFAESKKDNNENSQKRENDGIGEGFYPIDDNVKDDDLPF
nr:MAG TPA: Single strand binding protein [Caudoviricetes sp.]